MWQLTSLMRLLVCLREQAAPWSSTPGHAAQTCPRRAREVVWKDACACLPWCCMSMTGCMCTQGVPGQGLSDSVRKYRQSVFKLNYKIKKHKSGSSQAIKDLVNSAQTTAPAGPTIPATAGARVTSSSGTTPCGPSPKESESSGGSLIDAIVEEPVPSSHPLLAAAAQEATCMASGNTNPGAPAADAAALQLPEPMMKDAATSQPAL